MAVGTRTAPAFTATATDRHTTIHLIDASGDKWSQNLRVPVAATAANLETIIAAYQAATQASVWAVTDEILRAGTADPDNAGTDQRNSGAQGINLLFKNLTTHLTQPFRVIAPILADMQGNQDIPLLSATEMTDLIVAIGVVLTGFTFEQAQYTDRTERSNNPIIR